MPPRCRRLPVGPPDRPRLTALTIDVEDYFHTTAMEAPCPPAAWDAMPARVEANTRRVLDLLDETGVRATFFVLGWVASRWPGLVAEIHRRGHEVGCHGFAHRRAPELGPVAFRADVQRARALLEDITGRGVDGFRAASFSIVRDSMWALDVLVELGFAYDASIFPVRHDLYGMPEFGRAPVWLRRPAGAILEIPASTVCLFGRNWPVAGGGYFRLFPYVLTRAALRRLDRRDGLAGMVYLHPWEFDPDQPRLAAGWRSRLRQYANLHATVPRLRRLLRDFRCAPIREVFGDLLEDGPPWT